MHFPVRLFIFLTVASLACGQSTPPPAVSPPPILLDPLVVTGFADPRSVFDLAQGASILSGDSLNQRKTGTLGETLSGLPGVSSTYYGPGASRPLIRGLGGDRVRMLDNGIGSLDASNISPDHNVSIEPLLVERIEVLRGPSTLLYGSSAVGGAVNVIDNRIPSVPVTKPVSGQGEVRYGTAANERTSVLTASAGNESLAFQVNGLTSKSDDVAIPGYADPSNPTNEGTLTNSAVSTRSGSVGSTYFWAAGNAGLALSEYRTDYGVPVGEPIEIDLIQRRADFRAEITQPFGIFKAVKGRFGLADYTHSEIDTPTHQTNTTFDNQAYEGRLEFIQEDHGDLSGTIGLQTARSDFSAVGVEVVTPPSVTYNHALFALEEYKINREFTVQLGGRCEFQDITLGDVNPALPVYPGASATSRQSQTDQGYSLSTGVLYYPAKDYSLGLSLAYSQRLPTAQERFANGPHGGTGAYEIGTADLATESSVGLDLTLRKKAGFVTGSLGAFVHQFKNFVFEQRDEANYYDDATGTIQPGVPVAPADLPIYQFIAKDALFYGGEAELSFHLIDRDQDKLTLDLTSDYVHAQQTTDDQPLPRIPPLRVGLGLHYEHGPWTAGIGMQHVFAQGRFSTSETETGAYTLLGTDLAYRFTWSRTQWELFARVTNLADAEARVSTSFLKDIAPLPGRNFTLGLRASF